MRAAEVCEANVAAIVGCLPLEFAFDSEVDLLYGGLAPGFGRVGPPGWLFAWSLMATASFDLAALPQAADDGRQRRGMSWSVLSSGIGVSDSTMRRFGTADDAEAEGVLAVIRWLGVAPEAFVDSGTARGRRLPATSSKVVRVDMDAVAIAADTDLSPPAGRER